MGWGLDKLAEGGEEKEGLRTLPRAADLDGGLGEMRPLREDRWNTRWGPEWRHEASERGGQEDSDKADLLFNFSHWPLICKHHLSVTHMLFPQRKKTSEGDLLPWVALDRNLMNPSGKETFLHSKRTQFTLPLRNFVTVLYQRGTQD